MLKVGRSKGTEIEIRTSETDVTTQAATLAHEIAHSLLHWAADGKKITTREGKPIDKQQRELEAEATAYVVCNYFGIQSPSDCYLATYSVTPAMLLEAVETIAATVKTILEGCPPDSTSSHHSPARPGIQRQLGGGLCLTVQEPKECDCTYMLAVWVLRMGKRGTD